MLHDYAACQLPTCDLCDAYGTGYAHGKDKAHFEVRNHILDDHGHGCGCEACKTIRAVLLRINGARLMPGVRRQRACGWTAIDKE